VSKVKASSQSAIFCHQNADPDATCSGHVLQQLLRKLSGHESIPVVCPEGVSAPTKDLLGNLGIDLPAEDMPANTDLAILVDTNNLDQLGKAGKQLRANNAAIVVVDHHHPHPDTEKLSAYMILDESASAAAEVVYHLWEESKLKLAAAEANALLAAIFVETKHFLLANSATFNVAARLVDSGAEPRRLAEMLSTPMSRPERIARLRAASRIETMIVGPWIVSTSQLGAYQSSAARAMLGLGADVAFVAGQIKLNVRVNMRSSENFYNRTGIHLARDLAIPLGQKLHGNGGGHPTAAGMSAPGPVEDVLNECVELLKEHLKHFGK
jgi:phosphoesterase RecJ-like protein